MEFGATLSRTKKPKVQIKRTKTSLGWADRIYVDGTYMGAGLTQESAREGAKRMLARKADSAVTLNLAMIGTLS